MMITLSPIAEEACGACEPCATIPEARLPRSACRQLGRHLQVWLGAWPEAGGATLTVTPDRDQPRWDGGAWPLLGVEGPATAGSALSVSPGYLSSLGAETVQQVTRALAPGEAPVPAFGLPDGTIERLVFRWTAKPAELPEIGEWIPTDDPRVPQWLRPFNGDVLIAWDEQGEYAAGVGRKAHNELAQEIAVGTDPAHRGKGLAPMLVAQAARRILAEGVLPLYLHTPDNDASARVAEKAGFTDRGWRAVWVEGQ
jgi:RimJ/RimL family protein N-acetyltransferase